MYLTLCMYVATQWIDGRRKECTLQILRKDFFIWSSQQPWEAGRAGILLPHLQVTKLNIKKLKWKEKKRLKWLAQPMSSQDMSPQTHIRVLPRSTQRMSTMYPLHSFLSYIQSRSNFTEIWHLKGRMVLWLWGYHLPSANKPENHLPTSQQKTMPFSSIYHF